MTSEPVKDETENVEKQEVKEDEIPKEQAEEVEVEAKGEEVEVETKADEEDKEENKEQDKEEEKADDDDNNKAKEDEVKAHALEKMQLSFTKATAEEFVTRTYKLVSLRSWLDNDKSDSPASSSLVIQTLINSNLLTADTANRYLEKKSSRLTQLKTTLPEDLFGFVNGNLKPQIHKLQDKDNADFLLQIVAVYFKVLTDAQKSYREELLKDRKQCCAGSNDFDQMAQKVKELQTLVTTECQLTLAAQDKLHQGAQALIALYTADADYAAQKVCYYIFHELMEQEQEQQPQQQDTIITPLFTDQWLKPTNATNTSSVPQITACLEEQTSHLQEDLDPTMFPKALQALVTRFVHYYLERLLQTCTAHKSLEEPYWPDTAAALQQIQTDISSAQTFFESLAQDRHKPLIHAELDLLTTIHHILSIAAASSSATPTDESNTSSTNDLKDSILALQARIEKYDTTYYVMGDLYHLVAPTQERYAYETTKSLARQLRAYNRRDDPEIVPGLSLRVMLQHHLVASRGQRTRLGAGVFNNLLGRIGGAITSSTTGNINRTASSASHMTPPQDKLTYEELEKELFDVKQELEEATERAQQAEDQVDTLRRELQHTKDQLAEVNLEALQRTANGGNSRSKSPPPKRNGSNSSSRSKSPPPKRPSNEVDV
ncbi:Exocyst complex component [Seminavis robusta]|uniref:Exocyst complex component n=1 Tax=Seminavis robusta TaxID=568900 RepID=A0A9N8DSG5_9STRA|nr:Exocyst complex component [Seminavis robusta]|eukprot:Sro255_g100370.1 Exocyst complex component (660) ;mRNA; r:33591-35570